MLILSRKPGESIMIGDQVEITVLSGHHDPVRLGIHAPIAIPVHRLEIYEKLKQQKAQDILSRNKLEDNK